MPHTSRAASTARARAARGRVGGSPSGLRVRVGRSCLLRLLGVPGREQREQGEPEKRTPTLK